MQPVDRPWRQSHSARVVLLQCGELAFFVEVGCSKNTKQQICARYWRSKIELSILRYLDPPKCFFQPGPGVEAPTAAPCHRLDKGTSGIVVGDSANSQFWGSLQSWIRSPRVASKSWLVLCTVVTREPIWCVLHCNFLKLWIGLRETLQDAHKIDGKHHGFRLQMIPYTNHPNFLTFCQFPAILPLCIRPLPWVGGHQQDCLQTHLSQPDVWFSWHWQLF